jgi:hypothetical protein
MLKFFVPLVVLALALVYFSGVFERFDNPDSRRVPSCPEGYRQCGNGDCVLISDKHAPCPGKADAY